MRPRFRHGRTRVSGYVLLPVVLAITLVATIAFLNSQESGLEVKIATDSFQATQAEYVAQSGLVHAIRAAQNSGCAGDMSMTSVPFGQHKYSVTMDAGGLTATQDILIADRDSWIDNSKPAMNYGADDLLSSYDKSGKIFQSLFHYDLSAIPGGQKVVTATAWFYLIANDTDAAVTLHALNADWTESTVSWNNFNNNFNSEVYATIPPQPEKDLWVSVNVTALAQNWVNNPATNFGFLLNASSEQKQTDIASREASASQRPYLQITTADGDVSPLQISAIGTLTGKPSPANDISRTLARINVPAYQPAGDSFLQLQPGSGKDAMLSSFYSSRNYGDYRIRVETTGSSERRNLLQFDLAGLPVGAKITAAQLQLYHSITETSGTDAGVSVHRVSRDWVEGTSAGSGSADGATWQTWDGTNAWTTAGSDYDTVPVANSPITDTTGDWESWDIASLVQGWLDGSFANNGLLLKGTGTVAVAFASKEDADPALRPKLTITYACECGSPCLAPQGSGSVLLVAGNSSVPYPNDVFKQSLMESWGYTVTMVDDGASQNDIDSDISLHDVIYVSETVIPTTLGNKLAAATIGIVSEQGLMNSNFGFADSSAWTAASAINVTNTSHYISALFPAGPLDIYTAGMEQLTVSGSAAPGLQQLADSGGAGSLVVLDKGADMAGGGIAASSRVMLPLGRDAKFNWNYLNANGRLLVQRALQWGTGNTGEASELLFVIDGSAPTAQEQLRIDLMESWGYQVNLISDSDTPANFDAAVTNNTVAYIPQDIISNDLGTKLVNAPIGVVNEEGEQVDELGFSSDKLFKSRHEIDVVDNTHYITQPFAGGLLTFTLIDQSVHMLSGSVAPGLQTLGESFNTGSQWEPSLGTLDVGDDLSGGGTAAGRRVQLPWGGGTFDIDQLNDDGRTIMLRAIEWASQLSHTPKPVAHWKLDETSGTTAVDSEGGHDGTVTTPQWTPAQLDGGLLVEGIAANTVTVTHSDELTITDKLTLSAWMFKDDYTGYDTIVSKASTAADQNYYLGTWEDEIVFGFATATDNWQGYYSSAANLTTGWYHIAATFDNPNDTVKLYLNGALIDTFTSTLDPMTNTGNVRLGRSATGEYWMGILDDVRIYNDVLTDAEIAELALAGITPTPPGYLDEFNAASCDPSIDFAGSDGLLDWSSWLWTEVNESDGPCAGQIRVAADPLIADPGSNRLVVTGSGVRIQRQLDLSGFTSPALSFDIRLVNYPLDDFMRIRISNDGGLNWAELVRLTGPFDHSTYQSTSYDISAFIGGDVIISFEFNGISSTRVSYFDNVHVSEDGSGGGPPPGGDCDGTYRDEFTDITWNGSVGSIDWSVKPWVEVGEDDGANSGDVQILNDESNYQLRIQDNQNGGEGVERPLNLYGAASATLSFNYRREGLDNGNDYVAVYASSNGTAGPWSELPLPRIEGGGSDGSYQLYERDISAYISANSAIRLRSSPTMGNTDTVFFDNIEISCSP